MKREAFTRLRFGQLRLIVEMHESGSIRRAAGRLHMTQPAVSKSLKEVELILGARLYERTARGVTPTAAGQIAARGAKLLIAEFGMLAKEIRQADAGDAVSARIGITPYLGASLLPEVLGRLARTHEVGCVSLQEGLAGPLLDKLSQGGLDILIIMCTSDMLPALENASLKYERLFAEEVAIVASPTHPFAGRRLSLSDLAGERWILPAAPSITRRLVDEAFLHQGVIPPRPVIEATILTNLVAAAVAGLGIAAFPFSAVQALCSSGRLVRLSVTSALVLPPIVMVYRRLLLQHPRLAAMGNALRTEFLRNEAAVNSRRRSRAAATISK